MLGVALLFIGLLPTGPDREAPPTPQSASRYLRVPTGPTIEVDVAASAAIDDTPLPPEEERFLHTVDPRTFLTPYADSVLVEHPEWICDSPAPADALVVATDGRSENPGTFEQPLASITEAMSRAEPGQHILVRGGRYEEQVVISARSGRADAWITLRSYPGERAIVAPDVGQNAIALRRGSSYINIACFELAGPIQRPEAVPASASEMRERKLAGQGPAQNPQNYGAGIDIGDRADTRNGLLSHHVRVIANEVHHFAEMGISAVEASHITISGNVVYENALYGCHAGSGIGLGYMLDNGGPDNSDGYTNYIIGNVAYANENRSLQCFSDSIGPVITDGNGIILDENDSNDYQGRTLVADNVIYGNGGRGILLFKSSRADVINNVSYHNSFTDQLSGRDGPHPEIAVAEASDVRIYNNIAIPRPGNTAFVNNKANVDERANLLADPGQGTELFIGPGSTGAGTDFSLIEEAEVLVGGGIPFLMTVDPDGQPVVVDPALLGSVYNVGPSTYR